MLNTPKHSPRFFLGVSPWLLISLFTVLVCAIVWLAVRNIEREREHITQNFLDRADALIWALEAGTRTGIGLGEDAKLLQPFVIETAQQRGILYIAIIDAKGQILAHSNFGEVGKIISPEKLPSIEPPKMVSWHARKSSDHGVFEVFREFSPAPGYYHNPRENHNTGHGHRGRMNNENYIAEYSTPVSAIPRSFALIGFDQKPYEEMYISERLSNLMTALVVAMLSIGGIISLFWVHSHQRSKRLLKDTRALASEVVTNLPAGLITCEPDGKIGIINETALSMLRMNKQHAIGESIHVIQGLNWQTFINTLAQNKKIIEQEVEFTISGKSTPISLSASQIRDEDGLFLGHLFILRDISEMKQLHSEARRNDRLAALGSLAAGVAHEIRNPLSSIKGLATFLATRMASAEPEEEMARAMITEVDRLNQVVSQLLEFAKPSTLKFIDTNINEVILRALRLADADIQAKKIHVDFTEDENFPFVPICMERFTQALLNLFLNAIQASEQGGKLKIGVAARDKENAFSVRIEDNGRGMAQETLSSIFTPYFTTKASGTGLGLAIVHQIIEGHGGEILVESKLGEGSIFTLILPMKRK